MGWGRWGQDSPGSQAEGEGAVGSQAAGEGAVGSRPAEVGPVGSQPAEAEVVGSLIERDGGGRDRTVVSVTRYRRVTKSTAVTYPVVEGQTEGRKGCTVEVQRTWLFLQLDLSYLQVTSPPRICACA